MIGSILSARYRGVLTSNEIWDQLGQWQETALQSVAGALQAAGQLPADLGARLEDLAQLGFISGMQLSLAASAASVLIALIAVAVLYPRDRLL